MAKKDVFDRLPHIDKCCFCLHVKIGGVLCAVITTLAGILSILDIWIIYDEEPKGCHYIPEDDCGAKAFLATIRHFDGVYGLLNIIAGIMYIYGQYARKVLIITIYLYVISIHVISTSLLYIIILIVSLAGGEACEMWDGYVDMISCIVAIIVVFLVNFYFMVVAKSYRTIMRDELNAKNDTKEAANPGAATTSPGQQQMARGNEQ